MTREEAIKTVRNIYQTDKEKEALATLIPELAEIEDEDERVRKGLVDFVNVMKSAIEDGRTTLAIRKDDLCLCTSWLAWLEKHKPAEWSEEDEHRRKDAIYFLESAMKHYADTSEIEKTIFWLKSLRPSWRPSEEQMKALDKAIPVCMGVVGRDEIAPLESLYEQLQKL